MDAACFDGPFPRGPFSSAKVLLSTHATKILLLQQCDWHYDKNSLFLKKNLRFMLYINIFAYFCNHNNSTI